MTLTTAGSSGGAILRPELVGPLIVQPVLSESLAAQVSQVVTTPDTSYRIPVVATDPTAAWVAEGEEITPSDADLDEITVTPPKVAGLSIISRELAEDSTPAAASVVGQGLARDIARKIDAAFFGTVASPAPTGLPALGTAAAQVTATTFDSLDYFAEAISDAEEVGAKIRAFVTSPTVALTLSQLKDTTGSLKPLLGADPTAPGERRVFGIPLLVSPSVGSGIVWGIPDGRVFFVVRDNTRVEVSKDAYFSSDRVAVKATMRVGFGFPHPAAVVRIGPALPG